MRRHEDSESDAAESRSRATCARSPAPTAPGPGSTPCRWPSPSAATASTAMRHVHSRGGQGPDGAGARRPRRPDRRAGAQRDPVPARVPARTWASTTSLAPRSGGAAPLAGGEAQRIRLASQVGSGPGGGALCAGRALHRPAPAGQPAPESRPWCGCGTWATPCWWWSTTRRPSARRPRGGHRPRRGRARRSHRLLRPRGRTAANRRVDHRPVPVRQAPHRGAARRRPGDGSLLTVRAPGRTTWPTSTSSSPSACSPASPACRARASRRWSTRSCTGP